ncbi:VacJ family lipoprotein [bacterium]|nr:VacJ family lipoprotein [bacterium]
MPQTINDPIEPYNRGMGTFNHGVVLWFLRPIEWGYRWMFPQQVRTHIGYMGENLAYPVRLFGNLLQAKWRGAFDETNRFLINTTVGIVGIFDPAGSIGIKKWDEDFGQAFGHWGNGPGFYFVLPFLGPSSGRDALGGLFDMAFNPATYVPGLSTFFHINKFSDKIDDYIRLTRSEQDPYVLIKDLWALNRNREVIDYSLTASEIEPAATLQAVFLSVQDPKFPALTQEGKVKLPTTGRKLKFNYWIQPKPAPMIYILPGLGGNRQSSMSNALAEIAWRQGFSAVTLSSPFNFDFMLQASTVAVPGYTPTDAADIYAALKAIHADLAKRYKDRITGNAVMGLSLGALHTLFISSIDRDRLFSRYVAINPPLDVTHALEMLDNYYQAPLDWPADQRTPKMFETLYKAILLSQGSLTPSSVLPFSNTESHYLIGLFYHLTLRDVIYVSQRRDNFGIVRHDLSAYSRDPLYNEINSFVWLDYLDKFVIPYQKQQFTNLSREQLLENASAWSIAPSLRDNPDLRVFINSTDFLLHSHDIERMRQLIGNRLTVFPGGGHVGNLYKPDVQNAIMDSINDLKK